MLISRIIIPLSEETRKCYMKVIAEYIQNDLSKIMDRHVGKIPYLKVSSPRLGRGFTDLPGELRNRIYELATETSISGALAVGASCREVRAEYLPLYFRQATITLPLCHVQPFLRTFFLYASPETQCKLQADITTCEPKENPDLDMQWLLCFLLDHPSIEISFDGANKFRSEAVHLTELVEIVRTAPAWRSHLDSLHSLKLFTRTNWSRDRLNDTWYCIISRPAWELDFVYKPGHVEAWWDNQEQRYQKTKEILSDLDVVEGGFSYFKYHCDSRSNRLLLRGFKRADENGEGDHESQAGWTRWW